jgi:hypothetical protein
MAVADSGPCLRARTWCACADQPMGLVTLSCCTVYISVRLEDGSRTAIKPLVL